MADEIKRDYEPSGLRVYETEREHGSIDLRNSDMVQLPLTLETESSIAPAVSQTRRPQDPNPLAVTETRTLVDPNLRAVKPLTPLMLQYHALKARFPTEILLFRLGDFYEMFEDDAKRAAPILDVALTQRQGIPMCGVPHHAMDGYMARLLKAGLRVAIADQMEEPTAGKGIVRRDVVRIVTPGTVHEDTLLSSKRSNYLVALCTDGPTTALAAIESSTGEFLATEMAQPMNSSNVWDELIRLHPSEVLLPLTENTPALKSRLEREGISVALLVTMEFSLPLAQERLKSLFGTASLRGFGLEHKPLALSAAGAAARYLENTQCGRPVTIQPLKTYASDDFLQMDAHTLDHLDLVGPANSTGRTKYLLDVLDQTQTAMGGRLLRRWLVSPLRNVRQIHARQDQVQFFVEAKESRQRLRDLLQGWPDMERILTRLCGGTLLPRDLSHLTNGLARVPALKRLVATDFPEERDLHFLLERALVETPPVSMKDGGVIRGGYNAELDEVRGWIADGKTRLLELEKREREATGINSLKVSFNNVFGYYLDITKTHLARVPAHYTRKQTTATGERYITPELKEFETRILGAEERALRLETALLQSVRDEIVKQAEPLRVLSLAIAELDVFLNFAEIAERRHYVRPIVDDSSVMMIKDGRHPVLEDVLPSGTLIANDTDLSGDDHPIVILTGPNMSGKSTYLRQTALIAILAQMGSYVPAAKARIGVLDQLFTRIGASDRLTEGESTFMVEMVETARILNHATTRSLVILDEVGRGTSTYDGISIAWACLEFLHSKGPKVLFATHYLEITRLAQQWKGVCNAHVSAREWGDSVVFLHKVEDGPADKAYGIHVARLAGVPKSVIERASALLQTFEQKASAPADISLVADKPQPKPSDPLRDAVAKLDVDRLTPIDALLKLRELKDL